MYNRYTRPLLYYARTAAKAPQVTSKPVGATRRGAQAVATFRRCSLVYQDQGQGQGQSRRTFTASAAVMASAADSQAAPQFSAGVDEPALTRTLETLLASAGHGGRWVLIASGEGLERSFKFKTFAKTWDFMTAVSLQCKLKNHHPEWSNVYNTTYIRWTTHNPKGLSAKDVELAAICDGLASDFGEIIEETDSCELKQVADRAVTNAGDCCTPKK
ncbi:transcriptional coactivator/pterin dehydratase [Daldinia vernicosa]|uniref:transcriptional coactivator/pterin dehydratase n=1 Tax=Daldinia vernicosa TaxID=114800 RepID=UPI0020079E1B|nr:transcriptional coactivator/pterin dehydratase [Daldinia vernicosa]KAI0852712.1 transcriptional coactivator/pterin dehydratase [Daldinia vernicosa]